MYWKRITALSTTNATNDVIDRYPDIYLYATLVEAWRFKQQRERAQECLEIYRTFASEANKQDVMDRTSGGILEARADFWTP
jgi:hypothetical protein